MARFTNGKKNGGSRITNINISFSRITKRGKKNNLDNNLFLQQKECLKKAKSRKANHPEDSCFKITLNRVVKSRISVYNSSSSRVTHNLQVTSHE